MILQQIGWSSYCESPEAKTLLNSVENESVPECLVRRIELLGQCSSKSGGWVDYVEIHDKDGLGSNFNIHKIWQQCNLLSQAYIFVLAHMNQYTLITRR
jgi:hypothetical protein